jgi:hypothetical protein
MKYESFGQLMSAFSTAATLNEMKNIQLIFKQKSIEKYMI